MGEPLSEKYMGKLLPGLAPLAELVSVRTVLERQALRDITSNIGIDGQEWALAELEIWGQILGKSKDDSFVEDEIVAELQNRGVPEFPARLAYRSAKPKPMKVEPQFIDFGLLKIGQTAEPHILTVSGERVIKALSGPMIKVALLESGHGKTLVRVQLSGEDAGEILEDEVVLQGSTGELKIPVTARWEKEPHLLSWCPNCKIAKKSLFHNKRLRQYECMNLACLKRFSYPNSVVDQYNVSCK